MTSATYGRMQIGRCITAKEVNEQKSVTRDDAPIIGCSANILPLFDKKCSGNSECDIRVIEIGSDDVRPCLAGLVVYLEASFTCIPGQHLSRLLISVEFSGHRTIFILS